MGRANRGDGDIRSNIDLIGGNFSVKKGVVGIKTDRRKASKPVTGTAETSERSPVWFLVLISFAKNPRPDTIRLFCWWTLANPCQGQHSFVIRLQNLLCVARLSDWSIL